MAAEQDKGKGRAEQEQRNGGSEHGGRSQEEMKEVRRPPPLPIVKGTIGAIESPSRRSFYNGSPASSATVRGQHSPAPSLDYNYSQFKAPAPPTPEQQKQQDELRQEEAGGVARTRPVFRVDFTMTSCFDRLKLEKKEEIRSLFGA